MRDIHLEIRKLTSQNEKQNLGKGLPGKENRVTENALKNKAVE